MAALKEYVCMAHGEFSAREARCPHGCTTAIEREFRTAPGTRSKKTKVTDQALQRLATSFGMTNISNRGGTVGQNQPAAQGMDFRPQWLPVAKGDNLEVGKGVVAREGSQGGATATAQQYHTEALGNEPVATQAVPLPIGGRLPPVRPHVVASDNTKAGDFAKAVERAQ